MKRTLLIAALLLATATAMAQGTVTFRNKATTAGVNAPVLDTATGSPVTSTFLAQLYAGATETSLAPVGAAVNFAGTLGYFSGGERRIEGIAAGGAAFLQVKAWDSAGGASFEAVDNTKFKVGSSTVFKLDKTGNPLDNPPGTPVDLVGLTSFSVAVVPEPSTIALGALAAGALFLFRRK